MALRIQVVLRKEKSMVNGLPILKAYFPDGRPLLLAHESVVELKRLVMRRFGRQEVSFIYQGSLFEEMA
ncbi:MAG TPA: hypothetical protein VNK82_03620 [Terriglobales bacterium]|nr:hypothetical protein [Terriglobales bacterium]